jgi:D-sedoheptulose 7-phosphate isomerase
MKHPSCEQAIVQQRFEQAQALLRLTEEHLSHRLVEAAAMVVASLKSGGGVYICGNGGSAADAQHIAGELVSRFLAERRALRAVALSTDTSVITCIGNDYSFDRVFARQVEALGRSGDVLIGLSTSGDSPNVVGAFETARAMGLKSIAFTGSGGGRSAELADVLLDVPSRETPRVQECHAVLYHALCELVEGAFIEPAKE